MREYYEELWERLPEELHAPDLELRARFMLAQARPDARALDLGYNHLDTARIYGGGQNEALIGEALKGRRNEFFLASKCGITVDGPRRGRRR